MVEAQDSHLRIPQVLMNGETGVLRVLVGDPENRLMGHKFLSDAVRNPSYPKTPSYTSPSQQETFPNLTDNARFLFCRD